MDASRTKAILNDPEYTDNRVQITKRILDDLTYEGFYNSVYLKCKKDTITVFIPSHNKSTNDILTKSTLSETLRDLLYSRVDTALSELSKAIPIETSLIVEYSTMSITKRGVVEPFVGVVLIREESVYTTITSIACFYKPIMNNVMSQYITLGYS